MKLNRLLVAFLLSHFSFTCLMSLGSSAKYPSIFLNVVFNSHELLNLMYWWLIKYDKSNCQATHLILALISLIWHESWRMFYEENSYIWDIFVDKKLLLLLTPVSFPWLLSMKKGEKETMLISCSVCGLFSTTAVSEA